MARLVVPMEMLGALDYDDAVTWLRQLHESVRPGVAIVVQGVDRNRVRQFRQAGALSADEAKVLRDPPVGWLASEELVVGLFESLGWRWVSEMPSARPWLFEVSATR